MANNLFAKLSKEELSSWLGDGCEYSGAALIVPADKLLAVMGKLKTAEQRDFSYLADITTVDREDKFTLVYQLYSPERGEKGSIHVALDKQQPSAVSITALWPGADWMEREIFDLMGIQFEGHPYLKRILLEENYSGHPLRKDFQMPPVNN